MSDFCEDLNGIAKRIQRRHDGHNVPASPELLDEIEALLDAEAQARRFDDAWQDCEMPHLLMAYF